MGLGCFQLGNEEYVKSIEVLSLFTSLPLEQGSTLTLGMVFYLDLSLLLHIGLCMLVLVSLVLDCLSDFVVVRLT